MHQLSLNEIIKLLHLPQPKFNSNIICQGFAVDTRLVKSGDLFFALPGAKVDGHEFILEAQAKGACGAVVSHEFKNLPLSQIKIPLIYCDLPLKALQTLAKLMIEKFKPIIIGVTGSVGKTTTKDFITTLISKKYKVGFSPGNANSQIGIPLSVLNHTQGDEGILVLEMSMTHPGNIASLINIAPPDIAVLTAIDLVHAVNFNNLTEIAKEKGSIFTHPKTRIGILPYNLEHFPLLYHTGHCKKISFSIKPSLQHSSADYFVSVKENHYSIEFENQNILLKKAQILGFHNHHNLFGAILAAKELGLSWEEIDQQIEYIKLPQQRLQSIEKNGVIFINDSYNASTVSMKAALESLPKPINGGKTIAVLGEMKELGPFTEKAHLEVGMHALSFVDQLYCLGEEYIPSVHEWKRLGKNAYRAQSHSELIDLLKTVIKPGDVVLLKGSRSTNMGMLLEHL